MKKPSRKTTLALMALSSLILLSLSLTACHKPSDAGRNAKSAQKALDNEFPSNARAETVALVSRGYISSTARITARMTEEVVGEDKIGKKTNIASISPAVAGEFLWADAYTLEFKPAKPLPREQKYRIRVELQKLDPDKRVKHGDFFFTFAVLAQNCILKDPSFEWSRAKDFSELNCIGSIWFADSANDEEVEKAFSFKAGKNKLSIAWEHHDTLHNYVISGLHKLSRPQDPLILSMAPLRDEKRQAIQRSVSIPVRTEFSVSAIETIEKGERYVEARFSDPLDPGQDFRGFLSVSAKRELRFSAQGETLRIYSNEGWPDDFIVKVNPGLKNALGEPLAKGLERSLSFRPLPPGLRFVGKGVIVPRKSGVTVPIETVNLCGVIVEIQRIYADKIGQFLQVNELDGSSEINRVGTTIWKKIVPIDFDESRRNQWIRSSLDLSPLIEADGHSLYRIQLSCDVRMSEYPGAKNLSEDELRSHSLGRLELSAPSSRIRVLGESYWATSGKAGAGSDDEDEDYYYYDEDSSTPNSPGFFSGHYYGNRDNRPKVRDFRNFLLSDLGLIAQRDASSNLNVAVTRLSDLSPVKDAEVSAYDFQRRVLAQAKTNGAGFANFSALEGADVLMVEAGGERGYLKLRGSSSLSVSHFDVAGEQVQRGVKGFIYGERGVWRPGDEIHLTLITQDKYSSLPDEHPATLSFFDPQGKFLSSQREDERLGNFYRFTLKTGKDDITGTYTAKIQLGGLDFSKDIPVETIKPNRLKIEMGVEGVGQELEGGDKQANIAASWLHGAKASDMKADVEMRLAPSATTFKGYEDFSFTDPTRDFRMESKTIYKGSLDSGGKARFNFKLSPNASSPGKLTAFFKTRVYEPGGNINADSFSMPYSPYAEYVGIQLPELRSKWDYLEMGKEHRVDLALLDGQGKPVDKGDIEIRVYRLSWQWWWESSEEKVADYLGNKGYEMVLASTVSATKGRAQWKFNLQDQECSGRYFIMAKSLKSGHVTGAKAYMYWSYWHYSSGEDDGESAGADMLVLSSERESYNVGDTAKLTIPSSAGGKALISVENNGRIISQEWMDTKAEKSLYQLKLGADMTPNVYVHVSLIQPHGQSANDRPIRMYGILPIKVEDPATHLKPQISCADDFEPNSTVKIAVSEAQGREMNYTLALVDEGLLNITRFATPNAWNQFFKRDAMAVDTFDVYGQVAAAYGGELERLLAVGGSEEGYGDNGRKADRFPPVVRFIGPFKLAKGQKAKHDLEIPQYVGAVRVMVVAGNDSAYGSAEKTVAVKKPVMTYSTLPRVVSVGERLSLPISVFALEDSIRKVEVSLKVSGPLEVVGEAKKTVSFQKSGEQLINFQLASAKLPGLGKVVIQASSGKASATESVEMDVRLPNPPISQVQEFILSPNKEMSIQPVQVGMAGTNEYTIELSKVAPVNLQGRLNYLLSYPHGCVEQTTSAAFPQLYLDRLSSLNEEELAMVRRNVQAGINRLQKFQTSSGGLSYWPGEFKVSAYGTVYAAHFILEAEALGYLVPDSMRKGLIRYLKNQAGFWKWNSDRDDLIQAYALFDLALAGQGDLGSMNRMRERKDLDAASRLKLASAFALSGQVDEAKRLAAQYELKPKTIALADDSYGSELRDQAILAEGLLASGLKERSLGIVVQLSKSLATENWYSTQTTAYCLLAIGKYYALSESSAGKLGFSYQYEWEGAKAKVDSVTPFSKIQLPPSKQSTLGATKISSQESEPLYLRLISRGIPKPAQVEASSNGLSLGISYLNKDKVSISPSSLPQGQDFVAEIRVKNTSPSTRRNLALSYLVPAGWEIVNPRFEGWETSPNGRRPDYQDLRDDRVYSYFSLAGNEEMLIRVMHTAAYQGEFFLPSVVVESMYDPGVKANSGSGTVRVVAAESSEGDQ